jgi:hypothetical protein
MSDTTTKARERMTAKPADIAISPVRDEKTDEVTTAPSQVALEGAKPDAPAATPAEVRAPRPTPWSRPGTTTGDALDASHRPQSQAAASLARAGVAPAPSFGPTGKRRSSAAVAMLSVLTLGVYALVWHRRINLEMRDFDPRMHVHPARSTFPIVFAWLLGILITLTGAARIIAAVLGVTLPFDPGFTVLQAYILLGGILVIPYIELLLPISLVAITMTLERVRIVEDRVGRTTDVQLRPARSVCLLLLPIIGGLILQGSVQRRLNRVWDMASAPLLAGRLSRL